MGGIGSGRRNQGGQKATNDMLALDVRQLLRDGFLAASQDCYWHWTVNGQRVASIQIRSELNRVRLSYRIRLNDGEWQSMEYPVYLEWTGLHFGGRRVWFRCPAKGCGRRVAKLFGGSIFACRHCQHLVYKCQRETDDERAARRADKIRERLGWEPGFLNGEGWKPKGMHWRTYERLKATHDRHVGASLAGIALRLGMTDHGLGELSSVPDDLNL